MRSRFAHTALALTVGLWTAGCGSNGPAASGSVAAADAGPVGAPAADAGTPADAGSAVITDAGMGPDAGTVASSGGNDAGATSGSDDAGTSSTGGGNDAGTAASDDCDGLRPPSDPGAASASHFIFVRDSTGNDGCGGGASSGTGTLALTMAAYHSGTTDFVTMSGAVLASTSSSPSSLIGGASGFIEDQTPSVMEVLQAWSDSGAMQAQSPGQVSQPIPPAEDPLGGVVALTVSPPRITSYDPSLAVRWAVNRPSDYPVAMAVDRAGATLYLFDGTAYFGANTVAGMWIDHAGVAGSIFEMLGPQSDLAFRLPFALTQRTGSGLFLSRSAQWIAQIDSLAPASSAAPAWLQARPNSQLHMVHGGKGYAVLPPYSAYASDVRDCAQTVEVVSPSGASCGATTFRGAAGTCRPVSIAVGYDGTVIQLAPDPDPKHMEWFGPGTCYWQWWTGFFR